MEEINTNNNRRDFLKLMGAVSVGFLGLQSFSQFAAKGTWENRLGRGYGPLYPDKDKVLELPKGFTYKIISKTGDPMTDGFLTPGKPDGMGTFRGSNGRVVIVRNHEQLPSYVDASPFGKNNYLMKKIRKPAKVFDRGYEKTPHLGGTTTLVYNESKQMVEKSFLSLSGTCRNCAGGITPWGSWLTCEEVFLNKNTDTHQREHGYVFEVPATEYIRIKYPLPIRAMGKFNHEAVAVDPKTGIVYLTEDRGDGLFYRYIPKVKGKLHEGGKLQALAFVWKKSMDTRNWKEVTVKTKTQYAVRWITLDNVDPQEDDLRLRGFEKGAARFARGEGMWMGKDGVYFACTNGGKSKTGQIFRYIPSRYEGTGKEKNKAYYPRLQVFTEPNDTKYLRYCDNLTVTPWGDIVFCEDGGSNSRITGITPEGKFYYIAKNIMSSSELTGVCFSPSGKTMFVNMQHDGLTIAITGNWKNRVV
ncbi:MAG: PhoX family protein [Saprospiraceae bacterium]|nr:PhoX family protein [Saprospiraceae bacterium]